MFVILGLVRETDTLDSCKSFGGSHAVDHDSGESGEEVCEPTDDLERLVFLVLEVEPFRCREHAYGDFSQYLLVREGEIRKPGRILRRG